jgi:hypothetical protein
MSVNQFLENNNRNLKTLISSLWDRFGRCPTEDEVLDFIYGDQEIREQIWNSTYTPTKEQL